MFTSFMRNFRSRIKFALTIVIMFSLASCGVKNAIQTDSYDGLKKDSGSTPLSSANLPNSVESLERPSQVAMIWNGSEDFDPFSELGTFVRAFYESTAYALDMGDPKYYFPGTLAAGPPDLDQTRLKAIEIPDFRQLRGYYDIFVPMVREFGEFVEVQVCYTDKGIVWMQDGQWVAKKPGSKHLALNSRRFTIQRIGNPPPAGQSGPQWRPATNVFGDWRVTEMHWYADDDPENPNLPDFEQQCAEYLALPPQFRNHEPGVPVSAPPILAHSPGWPAAGD